MAVSLQVFWQNIFSKCLLNSPPPSIKMSYKLLILFCCHGNWKPRMLNKAFIAVHSGEPLWPMGLWFFNEYHTHFQKYFAIVCPLHMYSTILTSEWSKIRRIHLVWHERWIRLFEDIFFCQLFPMSVQAKCQGIRVRYSGILSWFPISHATK